MKPLVNINAYSAGLNTTAFARYLESGGDPNFETKAFWQAYLVCAFLVNKSVFLYPLAILLSLLMLHPIPLFIIYPIVYFLMPPQPLIYFAIMAHNTKAVKLLVEYGVDVNKKSCSSMYLRDKLTPLELITYGLDCSIGRTCCFSKELVDLITPKETVTNVGNDIDAIAVSAAEHVTQV